MRRKKLSEKTIGNTILFPVGLYESIRKIAEKERRTIGGQIIILCETAINFQKPQLNTETEG